MQEKILSKQKTRTSNIHSSDFGSVSYDIFGSPYQKSGSFLADDSLDFGYLGKPYNADTELYDYGFRDYSPEIARFTSVDPIRDGRNWFSYVVNDPVNYVDLWGLCGSDGNHWIDNGDGTFTALEGATLWGLYGADWQEKSGFTRDPTTLQVGETVGEKQVSSLTNKIQSTKTNIEYSFSKWSYIPVEGIGVNGSSYFTGSAIMDDSSLKIFASGFFAGYNLVDGYTFFGDATLYVDGNEVGKSSFQYPDYSFIAIGPPFSTIGDSIFYGDFSNASSVDVDLKFGLRLSTDFGVNNRFVLYSKESLKIK